jgi:hypothetical protein
MKSIYLIAFICSSFIAGAQNLNNKMDLGKRLKQGHQVYGAYCGIAGQHPPSRLTIERWITDGDMSNIANWLEGPNIVLQVYAAEALIRLGAYEKGVLEPTLRHKIEQLIQSNQLIKACSGCVYSEITIKEALSQIEPQNTDNQSVK